MLAASFAMGYAQPIVAGSDEFNQVLSHEDGGILRGIEFNMSIEEVKELEAAADEFFEYDSEHLRATYYIGSENYVADIYYSFDEDGLYKIIVETFLTDQNNALDWVDDADEYYRKKFGEPYVNDGQMTWFVPTDDQNYKVKVEDISLPNDAGTRFEYIVTSADYAFQYEPEPSDDKPDGESTGPEVDHEVTGAVYFDKIIAPDRGNLFRGMTFNMMKNDVEENESGFSYDGGSTTRYYLSIDLTDNGAEYVDVDYEFDDEGLYGMFAETFMESEAAEERFYDYLVKHYSDQFGAEPKFEGSWAVWESRDEQSKEKYAIAVRRLGYDGDPGVELQWMCRKIEYPDDLW